MPALRLLTAIHHVSRDGHQVAPHRHPQHELVLVLRGRLRVRSADAVLEGSPGVIHVFPAGTVHDQGTSGPWQTICALFHGEPPLPDARPAAVNAAGDTLMRAWFHQLCELSRGADAEDRAAADAILDAVLHRLRRLVRRRSEQADMPGCLGLALEHIAQRLDRDLDVGQLARICGLSRSHLGELFRRHVGASPIRHHARLRLGRAKDLLANPYTSVTAVAAELGFTDLNWFVRRFRAEHGVPPGRWRTASAGRPPAPQTR